MCPMFFGPPWCPTTSINAVNVERGLYDGRMGRNEERRRRDRGRNHYRFRETHGPALPGSMRLDGTE